jgi:uncharacterized membrane protein
MIQRHGVIIAYGAALAGTLLWCGLLAAAPFFAHTGGAWTEWGETIYAGFHRICHQIDGRSLHLWGHPFAACARCSAIYIAFLAGMLVYPFFRPLRTPQTTSRRTLMLALAPMAVDVALAVAGVHDSTTISRLITGAFFGFLLPFVVLPVYLGAVLELLSPTPTLSHHMKGTADA